MYKIISTLIMAFFCQYCLAYSSVNTTSPTLATTSKAGEIKYLTKAFPQTKVTQFFEQQKDKIDMVPDGTGLQLLFYSNHHYYLIAGPRSGRLISVNGGKIEDAKAAFTKQLTEEFNEETFGVLQVKPMGNNLVLDYNHRLYPIYLYPESTLVAGQQGKFVYVTFTGAVTGLDESELLKISERLSPTAYYWEKLGRFLSQQVRQAPQDDKFQAYWLGQRADLDRLLNELTAQYDELKQANQLIISPEQAFGTATIEEAWDKLRQLKSFAELKYCYQNTVGRYSERAGYFVIDSQTLLAAANDPNQPILDIKGNLIAKGLFNSEAVRMVFPEVIKHKGKAA